MIEKCYILYKGIFFYKKNCWKLDCVFYSYAALEPINLGGPIQPSICMKIVLLFWFFDAMCVLLSNGVAEFEPMMHGYGHWHAETTNNLKIITSVGVVSDTGTLLIRGVSVLHILNKSKLFGGTLFNTKCCQTAAYLLRYYIYLNSVAEF